MNEGHGAWTHLLLYDGVCGLCNRAVQSILRRDKPGVIHFCAIQSELGSRLYREAGYDPASPQSMVLLTPQGVFARSDAAIEIAGLLGSHWARLLKLVPRKLRDWAYERVANNRYRWFGRHDQCLMPQPQWRERFVG